MHNQAITAPSSTLSVAGQVLAFGRFRATSADQKDRPILTQALLVDDNRSAHDFLKRLIETDGLVQATAFSDPVLAMTATREREFDIVLVDYEMRSFVLENFTDDSCARTSRVELEIAYPV
jgi:PleD family two-component response regulator